MKTAAWETAPQIAKEAVKEGQNIRFWWRGSSMHSIVYLTKDFLLVMGSWCHHEGIHHFSRYEEMQGLGSRNQFLKTSIRRPVLPVSLKHRVPHSPPWTPSGDVEVQQLQQHKDQSLQKQMANALGKHQFVVDSEGEGMREARRVSLAFPFYGGEDVLQGDKRGPPGGWQCSRSDCWGCRGWSGWLWQGKLRALPLTPTGM